MKKWAFIAFLLIMGVSARASAAVAVNGLCAALISEDGSVIVEPGKYEQIVSLTENLFAAADADGSYRLIGLDGQALTDGGYKYFENSEGRILFEIDGKYGVMNEALEVIVQNEYTWIVPNGEGGFLALRSDIWDDFPDGVYSIDPTGYVKPTGVKIASLLSPFGDGLSPALSTEKGRYGYLNAQGQWEIQPQFIYAEDFEDGLAVAALDSGCGVIDIQGAWRVSPKYDYILRFGSLTQRLIGVNYGKNIDVYDSDGVRLRFSYRVDNEETYFAASENRVLVYNREETLVLDETGKTILTLPVEASVEIAERYLIVREGEWGEENAYLVAPDGELMTERYQDLQYFDQFEEEARFIARRIDRTERGEWDVSGIRCGVIDGKGNEILPMEYSNVTCPAPGWIVAEKDGKMELYSPEGKLVWSYKL